MFADTCISVERNERRVQYGDIMCPVASLYFGAIIHMHFEKKSLKFYLFILADLRTYTDVEKLEKRFEYDNILALYFQGRAKGYVKGAYAPGALIIEAPKTRSKLYIFILLLQRHIYFAQL